MALTLLRDPAEYRKMAQAVNPYGDGQASRRIADAILYAFGRTERARRKILRPLRRPDR